MKAFAFAAILLALAVSHGSGQQCFVSTTSIEATGVNLDYQEALNNVQESDRLYIKNNRRQPRRKFLGKRDTSYANRYQKPNQLIEHGKVIVMPPLGEAPRNQPQPGTKYGGARPETNPYVAAMAPEGTVPVAVFPPFAKQPKYPAKCVIYSQLTDYEDNGYQNVPYNKPTYNGNRFKRQLNETLEIEAEVEAEDIILRTKRESVFQRLMNSFGRRPSSHSSPSSSYAPPQPSSYEAPKPSYGPPTEPPVKVVYRKFGYVCEIVIDVDICRIGTECDEYGNRLIKDHHGYGQQQSYDVNQERSGPANFGASNQFTTTERKPCPP